MTEVFMTLLTELCKINPERFSVFEDKEHDGELWCFHDDYHLYTLKPGEWQFKTWLFEMLNELDLAEIWKQEGRTWEESILNAIVHRMEVKE